MGRLDASAALRAFPFGQRHCFVSEYAVQLSRAGAADQCPGQLLLSARSLILLNQLHPVVMPCIMKRLCEALMLSACTATETDLVHISAVCLKPEYSWQQLSPDLLHSQSACVKEQCCLSCTACLKEHCCLSCVSSTMTSCLLLVVSRPPLEDKVQEAADCAAPAGAGYSQHPGPWRASVLAV